MVTTRLELELIALAPGAVRIADAALGLIADDGFEALSVRNVAARAGSSIGAVQHHFATRNDLLVGALVRSMELVAARLSDLNFTADGAGIIKLLEQALPLDAQRSAAAAVWVELSAAAAHRAELAEWHRRFVDMLVDLVATRLDPDRRVPSAAAVTDAQLLVALVDGLALQGLAGTLDRRSQRRLLADAVSAVTARRQASSLSV